MSEETTLTVLTEIRNWIRAASYPPIKALLKEALPDAQTRKAYQMFDGNASVDQVRIACKMGPNKLVALAQKWTSMGLMEMTQGKKRRRLFDLQDFDLVEGPED